MQEIGIVETGTRTGLLVLRCSRPLRSGTEVYTGEKIKIKAKKTVKFRPGKEFKEFI